MPGAASSRMCGGPVPACLSRPGFRSRAALRHVEFEWHAGEAPEVRVVKPNQVTVDLVVGKAFEQQLHRDAGLEPAETSTDAEMNALAEREVTLGRPRRIELPRVLEHPLVSVRR